MKGPAAGKGLFVTLEGTEGTGKSTQVSLLEKALAADGRSVVVTREPGGTALGKELRRLLLGLDYQGLSALSELFLYLADRSQHMSEIVLPALEKGNVVLCDRFADATVAYQGFGRGLDRRFIERLNVEATCGRMPDTTILLNLPDVSLGLHRAEERNREHGIRWVEDRFDREAIEFHRRVQQGYRSLAADEPGRFRIFPADLPVEELHRAILDLVRSLLPPRVS